VVLLSVLYFLPYSEYICAKSTNKNSNNQRFTEKNDVFKQKRSLNMPKDMELVAINTKYQKCGIVNAIIGRLCTSPKPSNFALDKLHRCHRDF
jgi:hypothetical protein